VAMCRQYWTVDVGYGEVNIVNVIMVTCYGEWWLSRCFFGFNWNNTIYI